jgi:hypothetical protein
MWFADKLGPGPQRGTLPRAVSSAQKQQQAPAAQPATRQAAPAQPAARQAPPQPTRAAPPAPAPEPLKKKKGWF